MICKRGLNLAHRYHVYSQAYPICICPPCGMMISVNTGHFYFTPEVQCLIKIRSSSLPSPPRYFTFHLFLPHPGTLLSIALLSTQCSSLPSPPRYFTFHRPPFNTEHLSSHHVKVLSWTLFAIFPTFVVPLIISFIILSSFATAHIHRIYSIHSSVTSNCFSCAFFNAHVSAPYTSAVI